MKVSLALKREEKDPQFSMLIYSFQKLLTEACFKKRKVFTFHGDDFSMNLIINSEMFDNISRNEAYV